MREDKSLQVCVQGEWQNEGAHGRIRAWLRAKSHSLCDLEGANSLWSSFSSSENGADNRVVVKIL